MDPLIEVSTGQGRNMRETCARVLAAALMTGAIATVVGMSALFDTPGEVDRALTVPPSSQLRSVRVEVPPAPPRAPAVVRLAIAHPTRTASVRPAILTRRLVVRRTFVARRTRPRRQLAAVQPKPTPATQPAPAPEPQTAPPPAPPAPGRSGKEQPKVGAGGDHADQHDGGHGQGHDKREE
jgi:hypothetical protein